MQLGLEARQRIKDLTVDSSRYNVHARAAVLALLLSRLPALQRLDLVCPLSDSPFEQQLLGSALASRASLRELGIYDCPDLCEALQQAGSTLERLTLYRKRNAHLNYAATCEAVAGLRRLKHLRLEGVCSHDDVLELLQALPASVQTLQLPQCDGLGSYSLSLLLQLEGQRITSISTEALDWDITLHGLARLADNALLPSGLVGPQLRRISLKHLCVSASPHASSEVDIEDDESDIEPLGIHDCMRQLRPLLEACASLELGTVRLQVGLPADAAEEVLAFLDGAPPRAVELALHRRNEDCIRIELRGAAAPAVLPAAGGHGATDARPPGADKELPCLLSLAVQRMIGAGATAHGGGAAEASRGGAGPGTAAGGVAPNGHHGQRLKSSALLLLRGPQLLDKVRRAAACSEGRTRLESWLQRLAEGARQAASKAGAAPDAREVFCTFMPLPVSPGADTGSVLLECSSEAGRDAVMAAARDMAAADAAKKAKKKGKGGSKKAAAVASSPGAAAPVEALPVAVPPPLPPSPPQKPPDLSAVLAYMLSQVAQSVWEGEGCSAEWTQRQRLRWLLEQWVLLQGMPRTGYL